MMVHLRPSQYSTAFAELTQDLPVHIAAAAHTLLLELATLLQLSKFLQKEHLMVSL
jgi:hypothetical protein